MRIVGGSTAARDSRWSIAAWSRAASAAWSCAESATRSASASPSSSTSSAGTSPFVAGAACTRLTTMPPNGIPASRSLRWKKIASSTGSCWGEVTIRNVVAGSSSSAPTRSARSVKPSISPPSERKNTDRSSQQVDAGDALEQREHDAGAAADDLAADPGGPQEDPDRAALEEAA